ncbi:MAG: biotin carboxylase N-terminal domain-containing protein [Cryobacterium sp.]
MTRPAVPAGFRSVLVANRGEIACRILRTLRERGLRSVAVYSDADRNSAHVQLADVAVRLGPAAPALSYLNTTAILAAAARTGADAVHPGYGFLSENPDFAAACAAAGLVFIGPSVHALTVMGDKIRAKNHVAGYGVPVIPGVCRPGLSDADLITAAVGVGYPLLIKPSAGGGGKGMQVVERATELPAALATARRVAASAFGDDALLLERLVDTPRHIEVQILADNHGHVIHLGERECSLQRRHQKVIEEAPSPLLTPATRARIGAAACAAARSVAYSGAGTVEFLVSDAAPDEFFFMEMNTRLQVEHPVTEMVTGVDLVQWQLRVAAGEHLTLDQSDVLLTGHAIEARVYAETPGRGFLPGEGTVRALAQPGGAGIRVDSALVDGLVVGTHYDPMLAKVIAWGATRPEALARLDAALAATVLLGVPHNIEYLRLLLADPDVRAGRLDTGLIERSLPGLGFQQTDAHLLAAAALALHAREHTIGDTGSLWNRPSGWRLGEHRPVRYRFSAGAADPVEVRVSGQAGDARVVVGTDRAMPASLLVLPTPANTVSVQVDGLTRVLQLVIGDVAGETTVFLGAGGFSTRIVLLSRARQLAEQLARRDHPPGQARPEVRSPMPGTVVAVHVADGDRVAVGDLLITVEAMKMEHRLRAAAAGTVRLNVAAGALVSLDQVVASIAVDAAPPEDSSGPHDPETRAASVEGDPA